MLQVHMSTPSRALSLQMLTQQAWAGVRTLAECTPVVGAGVVGVRGWCRKVGEILGGLLPPYTGGRVWAIILTQALDSLSLTKPLSQGCPGTDKKQG